MSFISVLSKLKTKLEKIHPDLVFEFSPIFEDGTREFVISAATFILLDNVLGEYHTEMSLSRIDKKKLNENEVNSLFPIKALPKVIQDYLLELNN